MIDYCFACGKALEWSVDEYVFRWTVTGKTSSGLKPFCTTCKNKATMNYKKAKKYFEGQQTLL